MSKHKNINESLTAFALGELSQKKASEVKAHLAECPQCSNELKRLEALLECTGSIRELSADAQTCDSAKQAIFAAVESEKTKHTSRPSIGPESIWRTIMKSPITKVAAAAVIVIALIIVINQFGGSIKLTNIAWADVQKAFLAQSWVHLKYDNDTESWYNLKNGDHCHIQLYHPGKRFVYINRIENLRQVYVPYHGQHITENRPTIYKDNVIPAYEPKTAWETIVGHLEKIAKQGGSGYHKVEIKADTLDGKSAFRFDVYYIDALDKKLLTEQLWADPETKLPIEIRKKLSAQEQKDQNREYITGVFSFPETGPLSIYDLGVPKDLPVVRNYDKSPETSVIKVVEAGNSALVKFPSQYRAITWPTGDSTIEVVYRDGEKIHHNHYFNLVGQPKYSIKQPSSAEEVLQWAQSQVPVNIAIFDGKRSYIRSNPHPSPSFKEHREPEVRVTRSSLLYTSSRPHKRLWPYAMRNPSSFERIDNVSGDLSQYIGLRISGGDIRRDFYIDPEHDHICARWIWWKLRSDNWEKEREYQYSNFTRLPDGQWYAAKIDLIMYTYRKSGTVQREVNLNVDYRVLEKSEYPADTFNGEKLMEGAKIETY